LDNGAMYFGEWVDNIRYGKGILVYDVRYYKIINTCFQRMVRNTRDIFIRAMLTVEVVLFILMERFTKANGNSIKPMVKVNIFMRMELSTKENGKKILNKEEE
jgi:hypothetical protein